MDKKYIDFDIFFDGLLDPKIEDQKTCYKCKYNERGRCLMFGGRILIEAKSLCYKESGQNENKKD